MIIPRLKEITSPDTDLVTFYPKEADNFGIFIECIIGPDNTLGGDLFGLTVGSPNWISKTQLTNGPMWGRHFLIQASYNFQDVKRKIEVLCNEAKSEDWSRAALILARYLEWEFEDYKG